jgi:hypothetical protein
MQLPPLSVLLSWPAPNYANPSEVRGPQLLIITLVFLPIAVLMVIIRTYTRLCISKSFGLDDVFLLMATVPTIGCAVLTNLAIRLWGWNRHIWDVKLDFLPLGLKVTIAVECLFAIAASCTKVSLLILTRRLTSGTGTQRYIAAAGLITVACEGIIFVIVVICTCT